MNGAKPVAGSSENAARKSDVEALGARTPGGHRRSLRHLSSCQPGSMRLALGMVGDEEIRSAMKRNELIRQLRRRFILGQACLLAIWISIFLFVLVALWQRWKL